MTKYGLGYPFGQFGSAVPAESPSSFLWSSSLLAGEEETTGRAERQEKALTLCKHFSAIFKISVYKTVSSTNSKHSTIKGAIKKFNSMAAKTGEVFALNSILILSSSGRTLSKTFPVGTTPFLSFDIFTEI